MNMKRDLVWFLAAEIAAGILAVVSFRLIAERWQAGLLAGSGFVLVGLFIVLKTLRWPDRFHMITFYASRLHLWIFALPMLLVRVRYLGHDFAQMNFLGVPAPIFHRAAEFCYLLLMLGTAMDWYRVRRAEREMLSDTLR